MGSEYSRVPSSDKSISTHPNKSSELPLFYFHIALLQEDTERCLRMIEDGVVRADTLITTRSSEYTALSRVCRCSFPQVEKLISALLVDETHIAVDNEALSNVVYHCPQHVDLLLKYKQLTGPKAFQLAIISVCKYGTVPLYNKICSLMASDSLDRKQHFLWAAKDKYGTPNWSLIEHLLTAYEGEISSTLVLELLSLYLSPDTNYPKKKSLPQVEKILEILGITWTSLELRYPSE